MVLQLTALIPARNEEKCIEETAANLYRTLVAAGITHEILVINDGSTDGTEDMLKKLAMQIPTLRYVNNPPPNGIGLAIRRGLSLFKGDNVAIVMADGSDSPDDLVAFFRTQQNDHLDCVFGSRFARGAKISGYPWPKRLLNRFGNKLIQVLFGLSYNDVTNAFKLYSRHTIEGLQPLLSHHFNITIELPLKAIIRSYRYTVLPNHWYGRKNGVSKLRIKEMGSRYMFIVLYCFIERWLSRGDYDRENRFFINS